MAGVGCRRGQDRAGPNLRRAQPGWPRRRRRHRRRDPVGTGPGEIFGRVFGRQDLDHRLVLDPYFDHMERAAVAAVALPAFTARNRLDGVSFRGDAEREMGRAVAAPFRLFRKARAVAAARLKLSPRRIDLDARPMLVKLEREEAPRIGREWNRLAAHEFGENARDMLRVARGDRKMMDHGFLTSFPSDQ